eukprot:Gb_35107 [translate_table: standard]
MMHKVMINVNSSRCKNSVGHQKQRSEGHEKSMHVFDQAIKALAVNLPFESEDGTKSRSLPAAFSDFLENHSKGAESMRRHKKMQNKKHDGGDGNKIGRFNQNRGSKSSKIWFETEEYFREITAEDIGILFPRTQLNASDCLEMLDNCLLIPPAGVNYRKLQSEQDGADSQHSRADVEKYTADTDLHGQQSTIGVKRKLLDASPCNKNKKFTHSGAEVLTTIISPSKTIDDKLCHVCNGSDNQEWNRLLLCDACHVVVHQQCYGVQKPPDGKWMCSWCAYKYHRPSVSSNALSKDSLNDKCCHPSDRAFSKAYTCILCPRNAGALKPVMKMSGDSEKSGNMQFAHVFCARWLPETYFENREMLEPIKNVEGVAEERWKLLCSICNEKHGACIHCSHGVCATTFHPLCAKEAKLLMEISRKEGSGDITLRAFCPKHSSSNSVGAWCANNVRVDLPSEEARQALLKNTVLSHSYVENFMGHENIIFQSKSEAQCKGRETSRKGVVNWGMPDPGLCSETYGVAEYSHFKHGVRSSFLGKNADKMLHVSSMQVERGGILQDFDSVGMSTVCQSDNLDGSNGGVLQMTESKQSSGAVEVSSSLILVENLRKAVQQMQATLTDVAIEMGVSSDVLTTLIQGKKIAMSSFLKRRISTWLYGQYFPSIQINQSEPSPKQKNSPNQNFVHFGRINQKMKNLILKAPPSSRDYMPVEKVSLLCKERADNFGAMNELSTVQTGYHDAGSDVLQNVSDRNHMKMMVKPAELENKNQYAAVDIFNVTAIQGIKFCNPVLKGLEADSMNSVVDGIMLSDPSLELRAKHLYEETREHGLGKDASTNQSSGAVQVCDPCTSSNFQQSKPREKGKLIESIPRQKNQPESGLTFSEGSHVGVIDGAKDSQSGNASSKVEAVTVSKCMELGQGGNHLERVSIHCNELLKEHSIDNEPVTHIYTNVDGHHDEISDINLLSTHTLNAETDVDCGKEAPQFYAHQFIQKKLGQLQHGSTSSEGFGSEHIGVRDEWVTDLAVESELEEAQLIKHKELATTFTAANVSVDFQLKQLNKARDIGILDHAPEDELEGEIIVLQNALLEYALANRHHCEDLILSMIKNLSEEQQASRRQRWDLILVNQYLIHVREAKKQSRKERRHKEAHGLLTAAATSPRFDSSRRFAFGDTVNEHGANQDKHKPSDIGCPSQQSFPNNGSNDKAGLLSSWPTSQCMRLSMQKPLKVNVAVGWPSSSQTLFRGNEALRRQTVMKAFTSKQNDTYQMLSGSLKEESLLCNICNTEESTGSNKIYVCDHCKVVVHQNCYGVCQATSTGGWYCKPCLAIHHQYQGMRLPAVVSRGRPGCGILCALCGGLSGAFKKSNDGPWVHVFCAEWMPVTTVGKQEVESVSGLQEVFRDRYELICSICQHHQGACLMCNFSDCNIAFHPLCARDSGLYMSVKAAAGGKVERKAYCQEHSSKQRENVRVESHLYGGSEGLNYIKQLRIELERVRLMSERIVRREKLKRELLHCSHNIVSSKRDCVAFSVVFHGSFFPPADVISTSADISVLGNAEYNKAWHYSGTGISQKPYARPVESSESWKFGDILVGQSEVADLPTSAIDGTAQLGWISGCSSSLRGGSVLPRQAHGDWGNPIAGDRSINEYRKPKKSRRHAQTLKKEVMMTPTEASLQNQQLPKGYAYVPAFCLTEGKLASQDTKPQDS